MTSVEDLKKYFESGDLPNSDQFKELITSMWHKSEKLPIDQIEYLTQELSFLFKNGGFKGTAKELYDTLDKKINELAFTGSLTYETLDIANSIFPFPANGTPMKIAKDGANNGRYFAKNGIWVFEDNDLSNDLEFIKLKKATESNITVISEEIEKVKEIEKQRVVVGLNTNHRWKKDLINSEFSSQQPHTFIDVSSSQLVTDPILVDEHSFGYSGKALKLEFLPNGNDVARVVVPNDGSIREGDQFQVIIQINNSVGSNVFFSSIKNQNLSSVGNKTINLSPNEDVEIIYHCVASTNSAFYYWEVSTATPPIEGSVTLIGTLEIMRGDAISINAPNHQLEEDLRKKGLLVNDSAKPRNLLHINEHEVQMSWRTGILSPKPFINTSFTTSNPSYNASNPYEVVDYVDAYPIFGYKGQCARIKLPNRSNNFVWISNYLQSITSEINKEDPNFYHNFQLAASEELTINVRGSKFASSNFGTNLGNIQLSKEPRVINLEFPKDELNPTNFFGARLYSAANNFGKYVYVGKIVLSDVKTSSVSLPSIYQTNPSQKPKSIVEIGHSKVAQQQSIAPFCIKTGWNYSRIEIDYGRDGIPNTGKGGSKIIPFSGNLESIYTRGIQAYQLNKDVYGIYFVTNDADNNFITDGSWKYIIGTESDTAYTGDGTELDYNGYRNYWKSVADNEGIRNSSSQYNVTIASCLLGVIKSILDNQPFAEIYLKTELIWAGGVDFQKNVWNPANEMIRNIGKLYNIPVVDIATETNINNFNASNFFDTPLVHENDLAGERISELMIKKLV